MEVYEKHQAQIELYVKLAEVEAEIASGDEGEDFFFFVKKLREIVSGNV
jgi:hypothetical protein